ncbi:MAG: hypothetical protein M0Q53_05795 [Prolixibacteraceae bacterium]|nr:hypothetical protein [Prolixibacteraceae bacterium]
MLKQISDYLYFSFPVFLAYIPLDPEIPADRVNFNKEDSAGKILTGSKSPPYYDPNCLIT